MSATIPKNKTAVLLTHRNIMSDLIPEDKLAVLLTHRNTAGFFIRDEILIVDKMDAIVLKFKYGEDVYDLSDLLEDENNV